jgi:hypothetical protein
LGWFLSLYLNFARIRTIFLSQIFLYQYQIVISFIHFCYSCESINVCKYISAKIYHPRIKADIVESLQSHFIPTMSHWSSGLPICFPSQGTQVQIPRGGYLSETRILLLALSRYNMKILTSRQDSLPVSVHIVHIWLVFTLMTRCIGFCPVYTLNG